MPFRLPNSVGCPWPFFPMPKMALWEAASHKKGFIFLLQVLVYLIGLNIGQPLFHNCGNNENYTQNSAYQTNLNALLSSLSSNVSRYGFYNASVGENSDRVNVIVLCRGDVQLDACRTCINDLTGMLVESCPNQKEAIGVQDICMLRYSNNSIVGKMTTDPSFSQPYTENAVSVNQFNQELTTLLDSLRAKAAYAGSHSKFAVGVRNAPDDNQIIYALVQCTPDLSADDCNHCLINGSTEGIPRCCNGKRGGRVVGPSCSIRYATDQFFYDISSESGETPLGEGQPPLKLFCIKSGTYTENSTYQANLNALLSSLSSNVNRYGFYSASVGQNFDRVNAVVLCRGDIQLDTCRACINNSTRVLVERCKNKKEAIVWYDYCMVRYSNKSIIGTKATDDPAFSMSDPENSASVNQFNQELKTLLDSLRDQAAYAGALRKFATGNRTARGFRTIYALEQCVPDLSVDDCSDCLSTAAEGIPRCCEGGRVVGRSCNLRYETYRFFNETTSSEDGQLPPAEGDNDNRTLIIIIPVISVLGVLMLIACIWFILRKRKRKLIDKLDTIEDVSTVESLQYDFDTVSAATNYFSDANKLGQGGFGVVYKGELPNGKEIAVKRLSKDSEQGDLEFKNEVLLVAKLQHRNLVRLLGFSLKGTERLLIYEFMLNASLDKLMFDPVKRADLDWNKRYKIIVGVAKGLLYLHEDSRLRIIHRDLKASNVLLDEELNPKISDFGMARLFVLDETQANTNRIVGTYGYMSPEYAMYGRFSTKSDVFSFGVLVLEIVSGQKNNSFRNEEYVENLSSYAWKNWRDGTTANVIDPILRASSGSMRDIIRCIHIGLLCVQEHVNDRPTMASVLLMLNSFSFTLPIPSEPAFLMHNGLESKMPRPNEQNGSRMLESSRSSVNQASITELYPR